VLVKRKLLDSRYHRPMTDRHCRLPAAAALALTGLIGLHAGALRAAILEQTLQVPVHSAAGQGAAFAQPMLLRTAYDAQRGRRPFLVLLHGRDGDPQHRARLALPIYPANLRYFAARGFAVLVPLRVGYGATAGPDVEFTGDCNDKHYAAGVAAAVAETRELLRYVRRLPYVDAGRGLIVGESFGGVAAIAAAAAQLPGVTGVVNIAGGDGGDSLHRPDEPCRPDQLQATFAAYGAAARLPTLWLYSANDRLWGTRYPREWFAAFAAAGGRGSFMPLPADRNNGHYIFSRNAAAWHPAFEAFAAALGF
jgi:dienelactone hydrolase